MDSAYRPVTCLTLTRGQVAVLLGGPSLFNKQRQVELEGFGFPRKLPGLNCWSRAAVTAWIDGNGAPPPAAPAEPASELARHYTQQVA